MQEGGENRTQHKKIYLWLKYFRNPLTRSTPTEYTLGGPQVYYLQSPYLKNTIIRKNILQGYYIPKLSFCKQ